LKITKPYRCCFFYYIN